MKPALYVALCLLFPTMWLFPETNASAQPYPPSDVITDVTFNPATFDSRAPGSDNWPITWADDGHQYASWGDGGGFGGTNNNGRVSLGVARIEGPATGYTGYNVWGGLNPETPATFDGKSYGILGVAGVLYMWVAPGSDTNNYTQQTLYTSNDHALTWTSAGWSFAQSDDVVLPTFLQFGQDYAGARDTYVYVYAIRLKDSSSLRVQIPGEIDLMRVPANQITQRNAYEFFTGIDGNGDPMWNSDLNTRQPVFEDSNGVGWNVSVSHNAGVGRYLLCTEHTASFQGNLGIFDAPEPWGPWTTVAYYSDWESTGSTFFWNFSNKWLSADGRNFTLVFTGIGTYDSWNTVQGTFQVADPPQPDGGVDATAGHDAAGQPDSTAPPADAGVRPDGGGSSGGAKGGCDCAAARPRTTPVHPTLLIALFLIFFLVRRWTGMETKAGPSTTRSGTPRWSPGWFRAWSRGGRPSCWRGHPANRLHGSTCGH